MLAMDVHLLLGLPAGNARLEGALDDCPDRRGVLVAIDESVDALYAPKQRVRRPHDR